MSSLGLIIGITLFAAGIGLAAGLAVAEYFLCTRLKSGGWGAVIPILVTVGMIFWLTARGQAPALGSVILFVAADTFYWGEWAVCRERYRKKQQSELNRMKAKDI